LTTTLKNISDLRKGNKALSGNSRFWNGFASRGLLPIKTLLTLGEFELQSCDFGSIVYTRGRRNRRRNRHSRSRGGNRGGRFGDRRESRGNWDSRNN